MDDYTRALRNTFVSGNVDRLHHKRGDKEWIDKTIHSPKTRFYILAKENVYADNKITPHPLPINPDEADLLIPQANLVIFLGNLDNNNFFALSFDEVPDIDLKKGQFCDLREIASGLTANESSLLAQAKGMTVWNRNNLFCSQCGHPTRITEAGYMRVCTNPDCQHLHFPRTDPAVIVRVTNGNLCLLGRQAWWAPGRYSNIAGFVEPGESLETAVAREVWEETGIRLHSINYHSSQPWPFPRSLMLGFTAIALNNEIQRHDSELEDARWFTREEIRDGLLAGRLSMPSTYSISFHLIEDWFIKGECGRLRELVKAPAIP
jgi:NAD+ diphosphatase